MKILNYITSLHNSPSSFMPEKCHKMQENTLLRSPARDIFVCRANQIQPQKVSFGCSAIPNDEIIKIGKFAVDYFDAKPTEEVSKMIKQVVKKMAISPQELLNQIRFAFKDEMIVRKTEVNTSSERDVCALVKADFPEVSRAEIIKNMTRNILSEDTQMELNLLVGERYITEVIEAINNAKMIRAEDKASYDFLRVYYHELVNLISSPIQLNTNPYLRGGVLSLMKDSEYIEHQEKFIKEIINGVNTALLTRWMVLDKWHKTREIKVPSEEFLQNISQLAQREMMFKPDLKLIVKGKEILNNKKFLDPYFNYDLCSQIFLNAVNYRNGSPVIVKFVKLPNEKFELQVLNTSKYVIPDKDIDKILEGTGYHQGEYLGHTNSSGTGYRNIIKALKDKKMEEYIPNLLQKGRKYGVLARVPLLVED